MNVATLRGYRDVVKRPPVMPGSTEVAETKYDEYLKYFKDALLQKLSNHFRVLGKMVKV